MLPAGPLGYLSITDSTALGIVPNLAYLLNYWLADGFLVGQFILPLVQASDALSSPSSTVATFSSPGTSGSLPSLVSCFLAL